MLNILIDLQVPIQSLTEIHRFGEPVRIREDLGDWYKVECRYNMFPH